jgi:glycerol-3-phosphate cytidylyltransferase-like family protein
MSTIVIMPGGFHPFHAGHFALYQSAKKAFPGADLYVAATNDMSERPFPFQLKEKLAKLAGVEPGHFVQVKSPFQSKEITQNYDPDQDVLVFVRSEKDRTEQPKPGGTKKDGTPAYFQPWTGKNLQPFSKHAYMAYLPTVEFGPGITSATQIRKAWPTLNDKRKLAMVMSLYPAVQKNPKLAKNVVGMFDQVMGGQQGMAEGSLEEIDRRGFLKGAGAAAVAGAAGKANAKGLWATIPVYTDSDPPLPRTVKMAWNYFSPDVLTQDDKNNIVKLINLLYFAKMAPEEWRDSQNGRIIGNITPSQIYKKCHELLIFINDSFSNLDFAKVMNGQKDKLENLYKNDPDQFKKLQEFFFKNWETTVLYGNLLKRKLTPTNESVEQGVAEGKESDPVTDAVISFYKPVVNDIHKEKVDNYVDQARELLQKTNDPSVRSKLIDIFKKGKENPYMQGGIVTTVGALLAGGVLSTAQNMGLSPAQTNLALQAILNTVIPTVVSRINGKNWSDTIKYTLASAGIGTGIAGAGLIEDDIPESMDYLEEK